MTNYEQGFTDKCAEFGVDGNALLKEAQRGKHLVKSLVRLSKTDPKTLLGGNVTLKDSLADMKTPQGWLDDLAQFPKLLRSKRNVPPDSVTEMADVLQDARRMINAQRDQGYLQKLMGMAGQ